jgi:AraC-like DNA-binding protein
VHDALRTLAERRMLGMTERGSFTARVRKVVTEQPPGQPHDMNRIARTLGLSRRSLGRLLQAEGSSYKQIVSESLALVARRHLGERQMTVQETAYEMGFSDASAFHRAFKRWTGRTPSGFRKGASEPTQ